MAALRRMPISLGVRCRRPGTASAVSWLGCVRPCSATTDECANHGRADEGVVVSRPSTAPALRTGTRGAGPDSQRSELLRLVGLAAPVPSASKPALWGTPPARRSGAFMGRSCSRRGDHSDGGGPLVDRSERQIQDGRDHSSPSRTGRTARTLCAVLLETPGRVRHTGRPSRAMRAPALQDVGRA